ncbi:MAG TPA: hypothetical protein VMS56_00285 [Thermoanaerobaculia bacterium]|nr:hypothetical protein [Thermoanaerobaculia bacterium]
MDDRIRQLLKELGDAINDSISASEDVNERIRQIRDEGYNLYVVLDATIGLNREDENAETAEGQDQGAEGPDARLISAAPAREDAQFRIDISDLGFLRSIGIDPTRKVRNPRRLEGKSRSESS